MATAPEHSLEIWHRRKYGTASDPRPLAQRTAGGMLLEHYLDLAIEMGDLESSLDGEEEIDERMSAKMQKRLAEIRQVLLGDEEEDPWLDEWNGDEEVVDLSEYQVFRPEDAMR